MVYIVTNVTNAKIRPYDVHINDLPGTSIIFKPGESKDLELYFTRNQLNDSRDIKIKLDREDITVDTMGSDPDIRTHVDADVSIGAVSVDSITLGDGTPDGGATVLPDITSLPDIEDNPLLVRFVNSEINITDGGGSLSIDDNGGSITIDAVELDIRDLQASRDSVSAHLFDQNGNFYSSTNPLNVSIADDSVDVNIEDVIETKPIWGAPEHLNGSVGNVDATLNFSQTTTSINIYNPCDNDRQDFLYVSFDGGNTYRTIRRGCSFSIDTEIDSIKIKSNNANTKYEIVATTA